MLKKNKTLQLRTDISAFIAKGHEIASIITEQIL